MHSLHVLYMTYVQCMPSAQVARKSAKHANTRQEVTEYMHVDLRGSVARVAVSQIFDAEREASCVCVVWEYCIPGNFSDVQALANLAINSFLLKLQVANLVLHCNAGASIKVCTMKNAKLAKIKCRNLLIFGKR